MQTNYCIGSLGDWSQTIMQVKKPDMEVLGWRFYAWSAVVRAVGCTTEFSEQWKWLIVVKHSIHRQQLLVDIPAASMPTLRSVKTWDICGIGKICLGRVNIVVPLVRQENPTSQSHPEVT